MKILMAGLLTASALVLAVPAAAQGIYIGPRGGVGVGIGADPYDGGFYPDGGYVGEPAYQGRSVYRDPYYENDLDDDF